MLFTFCVGFVLGRDIARVTRAPSDCVSLREKPRDVSIDIDFVVLQRPQLWESAGTR